MRKAAKAADNVAMSHGIVMVIRVIQRLEQHHGQVLIGQILRMLERQIKEATVVLAELPFGTGKAVGLAEGAVGLVETGNMAKLATPEVLAAVKAAEQKIASGEIKVPTAFGMSTEDISKLRGGVRP